MTASGAGGASAQDSDAAKASQGVGGTGAGAEAAQGVQSANQGGGTSPDGAKQHDASKSGSEPLAGRESEHKSGYGGSGGEPRTSSDTREGGGR